MNETKLLVSSEFVLQQGANPTYTYNIFKWANPGQFFYFGSIKQQFFTENVYTSVRFELGSSE